MEYKIVFYENNKGKCPVKEYLIKLNKKEVAKILAYIDLLKENNGYLDEPYSRHIYKKIRELRINRHRILYSVVVDQNIILLHAFLKTTNKTPSREIDKAMKYLKDFFERIT